MGGLRKVSSMSLAELGTTIHATLVMLFVEANVRFTPLPRLSRWLGCDLSLDPIDPDAVRLPLKELTPKAARQIRSTRRVARVWPFADGPCLRSALVAGHLIRDLDPSVRLGLINRDDDFYAHAWVELDGRPLEDVASFDAFLSPQTTAGPDDV